jgi:hypothetical protein
MRRSLLLVAAVLLFSQAAFATNYFSRQSGNASATSTWSTVACGGTAAGAVPGAGDTATECNTDNVTFDVNTTLGSKAAGVGIALTCQGTGTISVSSGVSLTLRGFDTTTNRMLQVNQGCNWNPASGSTIVADLAADWASIFQIDGNLTADGVTFTIPSGNITWSNASGSRVISGIAAFPYDLSNNIYLLKLNTSSHVDPGPVANSAGTALGTLGDTSFAVSSGGFSGTTSNEVASYISLANNGDYWIDYDKGLVFYKSGSGTLTITYAFKYATWFSYGIKATNQVATGNAFSLTNSTIRYCGSNGSTQSETAQYGIYIDDHFAPALSSGRGVTLTNDTFSYCTRPLQLYNSNTSGTDATHTLIISGLHFDNCRYNAGAGSTFSNFADGLINLGYFDGWVTFDGLVFNSFANIFTTLARAKSTYQKNITFTNSTGSVVTWHTLPSNATNSSFDHNNLSGFGSPDTLSTVDAVAFSRRGDPVNGNNAFKFNTLSHAHRMARNDSFMDITDNDFAMTYHHGAVHRSADGYITGYTFMRNVIHGCPSTDLGGGWTLGYNRRQWIDNVTIAHNTFDNCPRTIYFNDNENTIVLGTRLKIVDNIGSNSTYGIGFMPTADASNFTSLAITQMDFNDDYNNTNATNRAQATFMRSGAEYNAGTRNIGGVYLFAPSGYTLPDATSRSLVLTASGTAGSTKSITIGWSGGTAVEYVALQGTATAVTAGTGDAVDPTNITLPTLTDSGKSFTTTGSGLKGYQVIIAAGTGSGQYAMIASNTATVLTLIPNTTNGVFATPLDTTSVYLIIKPDQQLFDSGGTNSVRAGAYSPALSLTSQTDSGITIATNSFNTNPSFVNSTDFHPQNTALKNTASDGTDVGALPVASPPTNAANASDGSSIK